MSTPGWSLLLPFDTADPEFVRGFEAGRIWERIKNDQTNWDTTIHNTNIEMVIRMCEIQDRIFRADMGNDDYVNVFIS